MEVDCTELIAEAANTELPVEIADALSADVPAADGNSIVVVAVPQFDDGVGTHRHQI